VKLLPLLAAAGILLAAPPSASAQQACYFETSRQALGAGRVFGCSVSRRRNSNGDAVFDVRWSDGQRSSYVFWDDGTVEIHSNGTIHWGDWAVRNGIAVIVHRSGAVTGFPLP
jgi:hypothetical protein